MMSTSQTLSLTGDSSQLECHFFPPIQVGDNSEIGLLSLQTYNSIPNVRKGCNNMAFVIPTPQNAQNLYPITVPPGCYEIFTLEAKIQTLLGQNVDFFHLTADSTTLKCVLHCSHVIRMDCADSIAPLLGFELSRVLTPHAYHESDHVVKIMNVNAIKVKCNLALGSFDNGQQSHTIHEFYPESPPGYRIVEIPKYCILYKLKTDAVDFVRVSLTDQDDELIDFRGETISVRLLIKNGFEI